MAKKIITIQDAPHLIYLANKLSLNALEIFEVDNKPARLIIEDGRVTGLELD